MEVPIYSETCIMGGREVLDWNKSDSADYVVYDDTPEELLKLANTMDANNNPYSIYRSRVADTLREAVYSQHPDLEPSKEE